MARGPQPAFSPGTLTTRTRGKAPLESRLTNRHLSPGLRLSLAVAALLVAVTVPAAAQASGTMQVTARVVESRPAHEGLATMQQAVGRIPSDWAAPTTETSRSHLSRVDLAGMNRTNQATAAADRRLVATIQYLRN